MLKLSLTKADLNGGSKAILMPFLQLGILLIPFAKLKQSPGNEINIFQWKPLSSRARPACLGERREGGGGTFQLNKILNIL